MVKSLPDVLVLLVGYPLLTVGAGWLIGLLLAKAGMQGRSSTASLYIGWLERCLIVTLVLAGELTSAGLVIASKSILRFGESQQDRQFAEYVLLGTLASVTVAVAGGFVLRYLIAIW